MISSLFSIEKEIENEHKLRSPCLMLLYTIKIYVLTFCSIIKFNLGTYLIHLHCLCFHQNYQTTGVRSMTFNPDGRSLLCGLHESLKVLLLFS